MLFPTLPVSMKKKAMYSKRKPEEVRRRRLASSLLKDHQPMILKLLPKADTEIKRDVGDHSPRQPGPLKLNLTVEDYPVVESSLSFIMKVLVSSSSQYHRV